MTKYQSPATSQSRSAAKPPSAKETTTCACSSRKSKTARTPVPLAQVGSHYEDRAKLLKALAHSTRLYVVDCLADRSMCVEELTQLIGSDMSTISKHLRVLKEAGVVCDTRDGRRIYYSLAVPCVLSFFGCIEETLEANTPRGGR